MSPVFAPHVALATRYLRGLAVAILILIGAGTGIAKLVGADRPGASDVAR